jgi:hypothetical protein
MLNGISSLPDIDLEMMSIQMMPWLAVSTFEDRMLSCGLADFKNVDLEFVSQRKGCL